MKIIKLHEQAIQQRDMKNTLLSIYDMMIVHLICIFVLNDVDTINHWCTELFSFLPRVSKLKSNNKYPSIKFLTSYLVEPWSDVFYEQIDSYIDLVNIKENKNISREDFNIDDLYNFILGYMNWLCITLSTKGSVTSSEVFNEITLLLNKYKA